MTIPTMPTLSAASEDLPPMLFGYAAMHTAMRRDAARLVDGLARQPGDAAALQRWWELFRDVIVRHHEREDALIWPMLAAADPTFAGDVGSMHDEHDELDAAMGRLGEALRALDGTMEALAAARAAAATFAGVLIGHLDEEERVAFSRLAAQPDAWAAVERKIERGVRVREAVFELPWMHEALDPARSALLWQRVPQLARPVARRRWQPAYDRLVTAAGLQPPAATAGLVEPTVGTRLVKPTSGTRGVRQPPVVVTRMVKPLLVRQHRRSGDRFRGFDVLYLSTLGARTGQPRMTPVARFDDGAGGWVVVASANGSARHPAWYHNVAAHPDDVRVEVGGRTTRVDVEQLAGEVERAAWSRIVAAAPMFAQYAEKTDRHIPLLRLTPVA